MTPQIRLGRIFGIEIGLHLSWFVIALLIVFSLAGHFQTINPEWSRAVIWMTAIATGLLFFAALLAHELSHALVAKARRLPVRSITLFALGGVTQVEKEAGDARSEFWMGIAGPIASAVIGAACLLAALALGWAPQSQPATPILGMLVWLGYINITLALFNMIPGFPLDGGRILRAAIWWATGDPDRSTRAAARVGQVAAMGFIVLGLVRFFGGSGFSGLWIAFIGWFLLDAARASYARVVMLEHLRGIRVGEVMDHECVLVDGHRSVQDLVDAELLRTGRRCFLVTENGAARGIITPSEIAGIERGDWPTTTLEQAMRPIETLKTVTPETLVLDALEKMGREDINQLPVVSNGHVDGLISRSDLVRLLSTRAELHM